MTPFLARHRRWITAALVAYWLVIFTGTHVPKVPEPLEVGGNDKALHYIAYAGLAFLLACRRGSAGPLSRRGFALLFGIAAAYGVCDELLQIPVGRDASLYDWFADLIGALTGLAAFAALSSGISKRYSQPSIRA